MKTLFCITIVMLLVGCSNSIEVKEQTKSISNMEHRSMDALQTPAYKNGSLYNEEYMFTLFADKRAYRIGDILMVVLDERTLSSKSADANLDKNSAWNVGVPLAGNLNVGDLGLEVDSGVGFQGESSANQQNYLSGAITVRVVDVLENGALAIRGSKQIRLNQGDEVIELQGIVRADDIDVANRISSRRIADAQISYEGSGTLANATEAGWLTKLFSSYLNPF